MSTKILINIWLFLMFYKIIKVVFTICLVQHFFKGRKAKARRDLAHSRLFFEELRVLGSAQGATLQLFRVQDS